MKPRLRYSLLILTLLSIIVLLSCYAVLQQVFPQYPDYFRSVCLENLTGSTCYTDGTFVGYTPNSYGESVIRSTTHQAVICKQKLAVLTITPAPPDKPELTIAVPHICLSQSFGSPTITSSEQCVSCLQSFPIVADVSDENGRWYLISIQEDIQGWINAEDGILNPPNAVIPTVTP